MANDDTRDEVRPKDASRRTLLKAATVAGGAVAASALLPGSWRKPVATVGGLPAHAQTSQTITIRNVAASFMSYPVPPPDRQSTEAMPNADVGVYCEYEDTLADFGLDHQVTYRVTQLMNSSASISANDGCGQEFTYTLEQLMYTGTDAQGAWEGNKSQGKLWFAVHGGCLPPDKITLSIHKGAAHVSNQVRVAVQEGSGG